MQGQQHALNQKISMLTAENQQFRNAGSPRLTEIATALEQQFNQRWQKQAHEQMNVRFRWTSRVLGKPHSFKGNMQDLASGSVFCSAFRPVTEWTEDQDNVITNDALEQQFGLLSDEPVDDILVKKKIHVTLSALTESESFDIVLGAAPSGLEALRRSVRRWDPLRGGKRRVLLRQIVVPDRCKQQDPPAGLEKWEELVRRYERSIHAERRQQPLMKTSRQLRKKPSFQASWNSILR